jgi:hypothetical protein
VPRRSSLANSISFLGTPPIDFQGHVIKIFGKDSCEGYENHFLFLHAHPTMQSLSSPGTTGRQLRYYRGLSGGGDTTTDNFQTFDLGGFSLEEHRITDYQELKIRPSPFEPFKSVTIKNLNMGTLYVCTLSLSAAK